MSIKDYDYKKITNQQIMKEIYELEKKLDKYHRRNNDFHNEFNKTFELFTKRMDKIQHDIKEEVHDSVGKLYAENLAFKVKGVPV